MGLPRVRGLVLIGWLLAALAAGPSAAEEGYPSRLVRVIVPFPPGSTLDALARIVTDQLAHRWAQPVIIENISGGGGNIGPNSAAFYAPGSIVRTKVDTSSPTAPDGRPNAIAVCSHWSSWNTCR
jgi:tripartite-type tricarboxylate transporter receptor subunit TctC